jgi:hypothetical protein
MELLEMKHIALKPERQTCQQIGATYLVISLSNIIDMIDRFTDLSIE